MSSLLGRLLHRWHAALNLPQQSLSWYRARLAEEIRERRCASSSLARLSETADIFYILSRSRLDGHSLRALPALNIMQLPIYAYLFAKFTARWHFYRAAAYLSGSSDWRRVREVINPRRDHKIIEVAARQRLEPVKFTRVAADFGQCGLSCLESRHSIIARELLAEAMHIVLLAIHRAALHVDVNIPAPSPDTLGPILFTF